MISGETTLTSRYGLTERRAIHRLDLWLSLGLFSFTLLTRLPFRSQILYHWDSINFAYALERFDIAQGQPHPPGYIGYVWLGRLVNLLFADPQTTFVWLSMVGSGLAVVALYLFGCRWRNRRVGLIAALFLASSPLFWFYGEIALPHALDALFVILPAWLLFEIMKGQRAALIPAGIILAVAGALRQQTPIFLAPLALYTGYLGLVKPLGWKRGIIAALPAVAIFGVLCALWFFPLINSTGGLIRYQEVVGSFTEEFNTSTSIFMAGGGFGLARNLRKLGMYTLYGWGAALLPLILLAGARLLKRRWPTEWRRVGFLVLWMMPSLTFYTLIHMGQQGLVFVYLPALLLVSAEATARLLDKLRPQTLAAVTALLVAVNVGVFAFLPEYPLQGNRVKLLTRATIANQDTYIQSRVDALHTHFDPEDTIIVAANWRHVMFYLPEYHRLPYDVVSKWELGEGQTKLEEERLWSREELGLTAESHAMNIILFDPALYPFNRSPERAETIALAGDDLIYFRLDADEILCTGPDGIRITENSH